ncbi:MAG: hypothetical protein KDD42_08530 [Bdellovibrionales bacterium]|nr:hypothetical protein [Bdellovibrionales bacterium]
MFGEYPAIKIVAELEQHNLLPAILFRTSRKQCDIDIEKLSGARDLELNAERSKALVLEVEKVVEKYSFEESVVYNHPHYKALLHCGAGAHHAGQLLIWRLLLEELMSRGVMRLMVATGTVAAGVDFPARSVIITAHSKRGAEGFNVLSAAELQQMSGRAGRRGKDAVGFCLVAPSRFADARVVLEVSRRQVEPLTSAYFAAPSTVLNLLKFRNVDDLKYTVSKSLAAFLDRKHAAGMRAEAERMQDEVLSSQKQSVEQKKKSEKRVRRRQREADALEGRQERYLSSALNGLEKLGHLEGASLSAKGYWAAELCTSLVLELAEAIDGGLFYDLSHLELIGLVGSISGDSYRRYFSLSANPIRSELFAELSEHVARVKNTYERIAPFEVEVVPDAALTVITWAQSESWEEFSSLLRLGGVAEGDVARLVTQAADHLNQISKLHATHTELARTASEARRLLLKPPLSEAYLNE